MTVIASVLPPPPTLLTGLRPEGIAVQSHEHDGRFQLTWPGRGAIDVGRDHVHVTVADIEADADPLIDLAKEWMRVAWWTLHDIEFQVGTAVSLDDHVLCIRGGSRQGKSTLAGALSRHGWRLLADGVLPFVDGSIVPVDAWVEVDRRWADTTLADLGGVDVDLGRPRRRIAMEQAPPAPLTAQITMRTRQGLAGFVVDVNEKDTGAFPSFKAIVPLVSAATDTPLVWPDAVASRVDDVVRRARR